VPRKPAELFFFLRIKQAGERRNVEIYEKTFPLLLMRYLLILMWELLNCLLLSLEYASEGKERRKEITYGLKEGEIRLAVGRGRNGKKVQQKEKFLSWKNVFL
jgi:hypothetical protein